jgi:hypothetical protein
MLTFTKQSLSSRTPIVPRCSDPSASGATEVERLQQTVEEHANRRTIFEVYATYALGTQEYNGFEMH